MSGPAGPALPAEPGPGIGPEPEPGPDLSHLTEEERSIILSVVKRQKEEEEKEEEEKEEEEKEEEEKERSMLKRRSPSGSYCYSYHGNGEADLGGQRRPIRDRRGRWHSQDHPLDQDPDARLLRQRQEEEFQTRYRSDPNLARYPVKPPPSEEATRMLAHVGVARHQRRHSDASLATAEPAHLTLRHPAHRQNRPRGPVGSEGQRSFSVDWASQPVSPTSPRRSPLPQRPLHSSPAHKRKLANDCMVLRGRGVGKMHVIGSFSSSEEELVTTPEYTSCEEPDTQCDNPLTVGLNSFSLQSHQQTPGGSC